MYQATTSFQASQTARALQDYQAARILQQTTATRELQEAQAARAHQEAQAARAHQEAQVARAHQEAQAARAHQEAQGFQITRLLDRDVRASPNAREHENLNINIPTETIKINKLIAEMQSQIEELKKSKSTKDGENKFKATGIDGEIYDLIEDIFSKNYIKWMLNVAKHLFTEEELMNSVLEPTTRSKRNHLEASKVALMREALKFKYDLDAVKFDKVWAASRQSINNKGRNIKFKFRLRQMIVSVGNGISRSLSNFSMSANSAS